MLSSDHALAVLVRISSTMPGTAWVFSPGREQPTLSSRNFRLYFGECSPGQDWSRWEAAVHPQDRELSAAMLSPGKSGDEYVHHRLRCFRQDLSEYHWFECCFGRHPDDVDQWALRLVDIDAQVQAENASRLSQRRKDDFLAILGHELRNPLATISNVAQALQVKASTRPDLLPLAEMLIRQTGQMVSLIDGLLEVTRIERGKVKLSLRAIDLGDLVDAAVQDRRVQARASDIRLTTDLVGESVNVLGDPARLLQAIDKLLGNALKFTPPGGRILVTMRIEAAEAVLSVKDTGVGIPADALQFIFEPFQQSDWAGASAPGESQGVGLGLALARGIIRLHGGSIEARSDGADRGAEFIIRLTRTTAEVNRMSRPAREHAPARVLVVDDDDDAAKSLSMLLEGLGHQVRIAGNGHEALELLKAQSPDLVLCDIVMPQFSGFEVLRAIRDTPELRRTRVVALTGLGQPQDRQRIREAGFDEHVVKPLDVQTLHRLLKRLHVDARG